MANVNFTVHYFEEDNTMTVDAEWFDVYSPPKIDENLMPVYNQVEKTIIRIHDDLDYKTIRVSNAFLEDMNHPAMQYNKEHGMLTIGEWSLRLTDNEPELDSCLFEQTADEFPRKMTVKCQIPEWYRKS